MKHKWFVMQYCFQAGLYWRGLMHDMSKFRPDEFIPYARYFYGVWADKKYIDFLKTLGENAYVEHTKESVKKDFDVAWLKHIHRNPHHHQYWLLTNDSDGIYPLEMPQKYGLEMLADWRGAGLAINGRDEVIEWYGKNKDKMQLHENTRKSIKRVLNYIALENKHYSKQGESV